MAKKFTGTKLKMTSVFKDGRQYGVTPIKVSEKHDLAELKAGTRVMISGISKGHGFTGGVKRWNFRGGPKTHGQKNRHRAGGSLGATAPQRVVPGRKMAGRMGSDNVTLKNLLVVGVDKEANTIFIRGAVPGAKDGLIKIVKVMPNAIKKSKQSK